MDDVDDDDDDDDSLNKVLLSPGLVLLSPSRSDKRTTWSVCHILMVTSGPHGPFVTLKWSFCHSPQ